MSRYAVNTRVPIERSKAEIERILMRYGAEDFFYGFSINRGAAIGFSYNDRVIKIGIPMPKKTDYGENQSAETKWKQEYRRRWRVLILALKAKLELIDAGLTTFEDEFLAQTCLPTGETFSQAIQRLKPEEVHKMLGSGEVPERQ